MFSCEFWENFRVVSFCRTPRSDSFYFFGNHYTNRGFHPAELYLFKVNNRNSKWKEICSKWTIKTPKQRQWYRSGIFIVNFEQILYFLWTDKLWWAGTKKQLPFQKHLLRFGLKSNYSFKAREKFWENVRVIGPKPAPLPKKYSMKGVLWKLREPCFLQFSIHTSRGLIFARANFCERVFKILF